MNRNSQSHEGLSYHVIFSNVYTPPDNTKTYVQYYIANDYIGSEYIDPLVYSYNRLFRCVNQPGIDKSSNDYDSPLVSNDKHLIIYPKTVDHDVVIDSIITYYDNDDPNIISRKLRKIDFRDINKRFKRKSKGGRYSNDYKTAGPKQIFIFNHPVNKEEIAALMEKKAERTGKEEYDKSVVLLELIQETESNAKMISLLREIKTYYDEHTNFTGFRLTIEQIASIEKIIEAKL